MSATHPPLTRLAWLALGLLGELVAPSRCAACDASVKPDVLFCPTCAMSVDRADGQGAADEGMAAFEYGGAMATAITRLKYGDRADVAPRLARAMLVSAVGLKGVVDLVVPVPLHPRRLAERGYNQAALLAAPIARALGIPMAPRALRRLRDTPQQTSQAREARLVNVRDAFSAPAGRGREIRGTRVLLVDDVRTTGATLESCARALRAGGARDVSTLVLARRSRAGTTTYHAPSPRPGPTNLTE